MKRKYLSLVTAINSLIAVVLFVVLGALFAVRLANGENFIPKVEGDLWIVEVINRVNKAGFNVFFTIASIVLVGILAIYRATMSYFYFKVFSGDGEFYKARKGEIIFFSVLSLIIVAVGAWIMAQEEGFLPPEISLVVSVLTIVYGLLCILPIIELIISVIRREATDSKKQTVPTRDGIMGELDVMADQAAAVIVDEKDEKELLGIIIEEEPTDEKAEDRAVCEESGEEKNESVGVEQNENCIEAEGVQAEEDDEATAVEEEQADEDTSREDLSVDKVEEDLELSDDNGDGEE